MSTELSSRDVMVRLHLQGAPFVRADLAQYKPKPRASTVSTCMIEDDAKLEPSPKGRSGRAKFVPWFFRPQHFVFNNCECPKVCPYADFTAEVRDY